MAILSGLQVIGVCPQKTYVLELSAQWNSTENWLSLHEMSPGRWLGHGNTVLGKDSGKGSMRFLAGWVISYESGRF